MFKLFAAVKQNVTEGMLCDGPSANEPCPKQARTHDRDWQGNPWCKTCQQTRSRRFAENYADLHGVPLADVTTEVVAIQKPYLDVQAKAPGKPKQLMSSGRVGRAMARTTTFG